ncbi:hypothetical protein CC86DRAFT_382055 [Ophiobolus disseminans]|uniref:Uncharacterized protein n=1 Tax=Ophiobolus disseminans TaxID=1469910 RepID=A0A6A7A1N5_9PLEO|nr:hypothetical protein CC86DRAFT_382055 [Ophiobolus disseminans]
MSAGDIQVAILSVRQASPNPNAAPNAAPTWVTPSVVASITFYRPPAPTPATILHFTSPGLSGIGSLKPMEWHTAGSFYLWNSNENVVRWGTMISDWAQLPTQIVDAGITISANDPVSSATATSGAVAGSSSQATTFEAASTASPTQGNTHAAPKPTSSSSGGGSAKGISGGAVAGTAIGCLIAGALIAGLVFWFCWRRQKLSRAGDYEASSTALVPQEKGFAAKAISLGSRSPATSPMSDILPLPVEDKAVSGEISKICNSIKNHVQSYYHTDRVNAALLDLDDVQAIGHDLPISVGTISTLLGNTATREIALRFCIAWVVCSKILPGPDSKASLLPEEVDKITNVHRGSKAHASSLARWRVLTAELMQSTYVRDPFTASDSRNGSIANALGTLENILRPYADSRMDNGQRRRNLEEILKRSALFAFTLFSQPSTWDFDWREGQGVKSGELCIFPALVQLSDETGQRVSPPRPFSEAVVRRLDG